MHHDTNESSPDLVELAREVMASVPVTVEILTYVGDDGTPRGFTISSLASVSADPPSILMCLGPQATARDGLVDGTRFCVSILGSDQVPEALGFAYGTEDPFGVYDWEPDDEGTPVVSGAAATVFGVVENVVFHHDTAVVFATVVGGSVQKEDALIYWRKKYYGDFVPVAPEVTGTW